MMADTFPLIFATRLTRLHDDRAQSLRVLAADGQLGVLAGHAPMLAELAVGEIVITLGSGEKRYFAATEGLLRVQSDGVVVIVEAAEPAAQIDIERAQKALDRARHRLSLQQSRQGVDVIRAELALTRAINRLKVARRADGS